MGNMYNTAMRMLLLFTPGREAPVSLPQLTKRGYDVSLVNTKVPMDCLTDGWVNREGFRNRHMRDAYKRLRAAWVHMLRRFADADYYTIFGEADCFSLISSRRMKQWIDAAPSDADIIKLSGLGSKNVWYKIYEENPDFDSIPINFCRIEHAINSWWVTGTHAMWIRPSAREKLADIYANVQMPVDVVLSSIDKHGYLNVYRAPRNITTQSPYRVRANKDLHIELFRDSPPNLLVVVVVTKTDIEIECKVSKIKDMLSEGSRLVVSVHDNCDYEQDDLYVRPSNCIYLADYLPKLTDEDIAKYPMTVFMSLDNVYPSNYLSELSLRYQCLDFSYSQYGFSGDPAPVYKGTLAIATASLDTTKVEDVSALNTKFMHYDLTTWSDTDKIISTNPNILSVDLFASDLELSDGKCRVYNDYVISSANGIHGVIQHRTDDKVSILWDDQKQEVLYKKNSLGIFDKV